ncbi:hypothetical protein AB832_03480 [Flavobacteriaceae bacterium (ex Bugula neritina AB1)]|nr:hypothetical protein AB832_03480 [Flavobacteriaceae bacterium (ex Bugula neritina AB1)]
MNKESRYQYLNRLAATRGEYLLYNKDTLYFGKPDLGDTVSLLYGRDLMSFSVGITPNSGKYTYFNHDYHSEENITASTSDTNSSAEGITSFATSIADNLFSNETNIQYTAFEDKDMKQRMDILVELQKKVNEQQQIMLTAKSSNTGISLGKVVSLKSDKGNYGTYRVTTISHQSNGNGRYENTFIAVPIEIDIYPLTNIELFSSSQPQMAKVVDTNDPEGLSRIKVRYAFEENTGRTSPWIRVATPYAGSDYGLHIIPEVGSSVIIGYHSGNVEQPYVLSSFYTGMNKHDSWQSEQNNFKGFTTKAGHKLEFNDTKDGEMITITDKNQNVIQFDTVGKTIRISAPENIEIAAKNISITAQENINIGAEENIEIAAQKDLNALADGNLALQSSGDMTAKSKISLAMEATADISAKGMNAIIEGKTSAEINGTQTKVTGKAVTEVSAGIVKIN